MRSWLNPSAAPIGRRRAAMNAAGEAIASSLAELRPLAAQELRNHRREKFLAIGRSL